MKRFYSIALFLCYLVGAQTQTNAQEISFKDSIIKYNSYRLKISKTGEAARLIWGVANLGYSAANYYQTPQGNNNSFHEMNAILSVANTGISAYKLLRLRMQSREEFSYKKYCYHYLSEKNFYLMNAGADLLMVGGGLCLMTSSKSNAKLSAQNNGFGKALCLQGVFRLLLDNAMYYGYIHENSKWYFIMDNLLYVGNGVTFTYKFGSNSHNKYLTNIN